MAAVPRVPPLLTRAELGDLYRTIVLQTTVFADIKVLSSAWPGVLEDGCPCVPENVTEYEQGEQQQLVDHRPRVLRDQRENPNEWNYSLHKYMVVLRECDGSMVLLDGYEVFEEYGPLVAQGLMPPQWKMWVIQAAERMTGLQKFQLAIFLHRTRIRSEFFDSHARDILAFVKALQIIMVSEDLGFPEKCDTGHLVRVMVPFLQASDGGIMDAAVRECICTAAALLENEEYHGFLLRFRRDIQSGLNSHSLFRHSSLLGDDIDESGIIEFVGYRWWSRETFPVQLLFTMVVMAIHSSVPVYLPLTRSLRRQIVRILRAIVAMLSVARSRFAGLSIPRLLLAQRMGTLENGDVERPRRTFNEGQHLCDTILLAISEKICKAITDAVELLEVEESDGGRTVPHSAELLENAYIQLHEQCLTETNEVLVEIGIPNCAALPSGPRNL